MIDLLSVVPNLCMITRARINIVMDVCNNRIGWNKLLVRIMHFIVKR